MSITLTQVSKSFASELAVRDISLAIKAGEFFAVLGPSGCGKSTLLRLIAGLERLDKGEIAVCGRRVAGPGHQHVPPEERGVGVVFQSYALWPHMSVRDNVAFPLETSGAGRRRAGTEAAAHLQTVELEAYASRKPAELSGGQRQRVALARCLAQQARTILMDEPLANLDPHLRAAMEEELAAFHRRTGATVLYITHDQREAMALADRLAVMWQGRMLQVGAPHDVYRQPANKQVARFIGRSTIVKTAVNTVDAGTGTAKVLLGGQAFIVACCKETQPGPAHLMIRPGDIRLEAGPGALEATVVRVVYRGGAWDVDALTDGMTEPLKLTLSEHIDEGARIPILIENAWVIPDIG